MLYFFYALFTAPGVMIHELAHAFFCVLARVKIFKIRLFRFGNPAGYVNHEAPQKFYKSFLISFGPLIINSLLAVFLFAQVCQPYFYWKSILYLWLGFAVAMHAIPSTGDAKSLFRAANHRFWRNPFVVIAYPLILILYILNLFKRLHIDIAYAGLLFWFGNIYL
jgi:hypothetical protein